MARKNTGVSRMSLIEYTLEGKIDRVQVAIERLKSFEPPEGYYLAFSGGKDSITLYELAKMSGVKFDAHFNFTTVDPPELLKFIREKYPSVEISKPEKTMWELIVWKMFPPTRKIRYCCDWLKERSAPDRFVLLGIRHNESPKRKKRQMFQYCYKDSIHIKKYLSPIIDWSEKEVWEFIKLRNLEYCCLYDEGYKRIGCILCPMATLKNRLRDMERYPNFYKAYLLAFKKMLEKHPNHYRKWETPEDVMNWWLYGNFKGKQEERLFD